MKLKDDKYMDAASKTKARFIFDKMMEKDKFSEWMGLSLDEISEGKCRMHFIVRPEMVNGFEKVHGGILFAASDSVFAFACNSHGVAAMALEASIHYYKPVQAGETLSVCAEVTFLGNKTGVYDLKTENEKGEIVCQFTGTAYRTSKPSVQFV